MNKPPSSFLSKRPGFDFDFKERDGVKSPHPDFPKSFFLTNYKHPSAPEDATLEENIAAAMDEIQESCPSQNIEIELEE